VLDRLSAIVLTLEIDESIQVFPDSPKVNILQWSNFDNHKYASEVLFSSTHVGTHVDAPYHFQKDDKKTKKINLRDCERQQRRLRPVNPSLK
jgi:kynurenine formamidase